MHIVALALAEGLDHLLRRASVDQVQILDIDALLEARVFEHRQGLTAVVNDDLLALERRPTEGLVGVASCEKEAVPLIDLGEVYCGRSFALLERTESLRRRRLADMDRAVNETGNGGFAGGGNGMLGGQTLLLQEAAGKGGDERRIECGKPGELDADLLGQAEPPLAFHGRPSSGGRASSPNFAVNQSGKAVAGH